MKIYIAQAAATGSMNVAALKTKLETLFPDGFVRVGESSGLGNSIYVTVSVVTADKCANKILDNSPSLTKILVHLPKVVTDDAAVSVTLVSRGYEQKRAVIQWRDFKAPLPKALARIGKWFADNRDGLKSLH